MALFLWCVKIPAQKQLQGRGAGFIFGLQFKATFQNAEAWGGRNWQQLVTSHPQSGSREGRTVLLSQLSPTSSVQVPRPRNDYLLSGWVFPPLLMMSTESLIGMPRGQRIPPGCTWRLVVLVIPDPVKICHRLCVFNACILGRHRIGGAGQHEHKSEKVAVLQSGLIMRWWLWRIMNHTKETQSWLKFLMCGHSQSDEQAPKWHRKRDIIYRPQEDESRGWGLTTHTLKRQQSCETLHFTEPGKCSPSRGVWSSPIEEASVEGMSGKSPRIELVKYKVMGVRQRPGICGYTRGISTDKPGFRPLVENQSVAGHHCDSRAPRTNSQWRHLDQNHLRAGFWEFIVPASKSARSCLKYLNVHGLALFINAVQRTMGGGDPPEIVES